MLRQERVTLDCTPLSMKSESRGARPLAAALANPTAGGRIRPNPVGATDEQRSPRRRSKASADAFAPQGPPVPCARSSGTGPRRNRRSWRGARRAHSSAGGAERECLGHSRTSEGLRTAMERLGTASRGAGKLLSGPKRRGARSFPHRGLPPASPQPAGWVGGGHGFALSRAPQLPRQERVTLEYTPLSMKNKSRGARLLRVSNATE